MTYKQKTLKSMVFFLEIRASSLNPEEAKAELRSRWAWIGEKYIDKAYQIHKSK